MLTEHIVKCPFCQAMHKVKIDNPHTSFKLTKFFRCSKVTSLSGEGCGEQFAISFDLHTRTCKLKGKSPYGYLMSLEEFKDTCIAGSLTNEDGYGLFATTTFMSEIPIYPSEILREVIDTNFTHIVWFNI